MRLAGFEAAISTSQQSQIHAFDLVATGFGMKRGIHTEFSQEVDNQIWKAEYGGAPKMLAGFGPSVKHIFTSVLSELWTQDYA